MQIDATLPPTPSVGRIVHYVPLADLPHAFNEPGDDFTPPPGHWAALIAAVSDTTPLAVWLTVFPPGNDPQAFRRPVRYDPQGGEGTWHWPERVG
jgi:hypothetical protein